MAENFKVLTVTDALNWLRELDKSIKADDNVQKIEELNRCIMSAKKYHQMAYGDNYVILP